VISRQRLASPALRHPGQRRSEQYPPSRPLLPARARRSAAVVAGCCVVIVVTLGALTAHQANAAAVDRSVDSWVIGLNLPSHALSLGSLLGGLPAMTVMTAALALGCLAVRRLSGALLPVFGVLLASGLTEGVLKPLVHRTITVNHFLTFPSGHTTGMFALSTALAVILLSPRSGRPRPAVRVAVVAVAVVVSCLVGLAMVALGFHYFTDTLGGAAVGTAAVLGTAFLLDLEVIRRWLGRLRR
jgi:membrane-associated phospholipid phosphatase